MSPEEIIAMTKLADHVQKTGAGIWKNYKKALDKFDWSLVFRKNGATVNAAADRRDVILPKLFR